MPLLKAIIGVAAGVAFAMLAHAGAEAAFGVIGGFAFHVGLMLVLVGGYVAICRRINRERAAALRKWASRWRESGNGQPPKL